MKRIIIFISVSELQVLLAPTRMAKHEDDLVVFTSEILERSKRWKIFVDHLAEVSQKG